MRLKIGLLYEVLCIIKLDKSSTTVVHCYA